MLSNSQMIAGRFARWAKARALVARIRSQLASGGVVVVATYTRATQFDARHVAMFKAERSGAYMQSGKRWLCIDNCAIKFYRIRTAA